MAQLLNGGNVPDDELELTPAYRVMRGNEDFTDLISRREKIRLFPGFDIDKDNYRLADEERIRNDGKTYGTEDLDESITGNLGTQIMRDGILAAPLDALDSTVKQIFDSKGIKTLLIVGAIIVAGAIYLRER